MTNNLQRRLFEHKSGLSIFTKRYNVKYLVWFQEFHSAIEAIVAEKRIKNMGRAEKNILIEQSNPSWEFLNNE